MPAPSIMSIEDKSDQLVGPARIGRVTFSKTGKGLYYKGKTFQSLSGNGLKANYFDVDSGDQYWISGPKKNGEDGFYGAKRTPIDEDVREEYWRRYGSEASRNPKRLGPASHPSASGFDRGVRQARD